MTDLYRRDGGPPAPLPVEIVDPETGFGFRAPFDGADLSRLGYSAAPPKPSFDISTHIAVWDASEQKWRVEALPVVEDPEPETLPEIFQPITPRQFFQALALPPYAIISPQEALDAVKTGEIPAVMQAVIDGLPTDRQFGATMLVAGGQQFNRDDPLVAIFGASQNMDAAEIDAFWRFARGQ